MAIRAAKARSEERFGQGERTRQAILKVAVDIASVEGLEGLSIGRLASELGMSKSGIFAHFGSKEELQIATVGFAREIFIDRVMRPALAGPPGLPRLRRLCEAWFDYAAGSVFPGGCFFMAASAEFDGRPGQVRDRIAAVMSEWDGALERAVRAAQEAGDLDAGVDPEQLAFELVAIMTGVNWSYQLFHKKQVVKRGREAVKRRLEGLAIGDDKALTGGKQPV